MMPSLTLITGPSATSKTRQLLDETERNKVETRAKIGLTKTIA
jgi:hypothetical protein